MRDNKDTDINYLYDKLVIFACCLLLYIMNVMAAFVAERAAVVPVIVAIIIAALNSYFESQYLKLFCIAAYTVLCIFIPEYIFFIPLIFYDLMLFKLPWLWLFAFLPVAINSGRLPAIAIITTVLFIGIAWLIKRRTKALSDVKSEYAELRDNTKELSLQLENKNKELMEKQDYEIKLATLNERNRIAREIHDSTGHALSSSILQIGALMAISKDESIRDNLTSVRDTLSKGMDSIRQSIHNLYDESVDLYSEIHSLINNFSFCPVRLNYSIESNPDISITYCFIAIVKEALSNIIRHSNATSAVISLHEHPAIYQLIIQDNGTLRDYDPENDKGIGIKNIADRIGKLKGNVNIKTSKGFEIFISVPVKAK